MMHHCIIMHFQRDSQLKRIDYFLDFQKLEKLTNSSYWFDERDKSNFKYEFLKQTYLKKPANKYKYPVMLYLGNKKFSMKYELEDILEMIKNGATKAETEYYSNHFKEHENNLLKQQFLNNFKAFTPCGIFYNRKSRIEIRQLNGLLMLQNNYNSLNTDQLIQIKNDKLTYAVFRLLDSNRFGVLIKTNGMTSKNYKKFQQFIFSHYNTLLGNNHLIYTQINLPIPIPSDTNIYINVSCAILEGKIK